jgi:hypothetical protein
VTRALAADVPVATVDIAEDTYAIYERAGALVVLQTPTRVELSRDAAQLPPACEDVQTRLAPLETEVATCKADSSAGSCKTLGSLFDVVRFDSDTIGQTALAQGWLPGLTIASGADPAAITAAVEAAVGGNTATIRWVPMPKRAGVVTRVTTVIEPGGGSWASRLLGLVSFDDPGARYDANARAFVTRDHVLACGLLAGDVRLSWEQTAVAEAPASGTATLLDAETSWMLYQRLRGELAGSEPGTVDHAVRVGVAIGAALEAAGLADAQLQARVDFVLDVFFEADDLALRDLSEAVVRGIGSSGVSAVIELTVPWIGAVR